MPKLSLPALGRMLIEKRGALGVREASADIGISPATLSRVERGHLPDLATFKSICAWLEIDPGEVLGVSRERAPKSSMPKAGVHFRKDRVLQPATAEALAQMILAAQRAWLLSGSTDK